MRIAALTLTLLRLLQDLSYASLTKAIRLLGNDLARLLSLLTTNYPYDAVR